MSNRWFQTQEDVSTLNPSGEMTINGENTNKFGEQSGRRYYDSTSKSVLPEI